MLAATGTTPKHMQWSSKPQAATVCSAGMGKPMPSKSKSSNDIPLNAEVLVSIALRLTRGCTALPTKVEV